MPLISRKASLKWARAKSLNKIIIMPPVLDKASRQFQGIRSQLTVVLLVTSVFGVLAGVHHYAEVFPVYWTRIALFDFLAWIGACLSVAWLLRKGAPTQALRLFILSVCVYLAIGVGLEASAAVALLFISSYLYGRALLRAIFQGNDVDGNASQYVFTGLAILLAVFGVLIHFPVNYRALYAAILATPILSVFVSRERFRNWRDFVNGVAARTTAFEEIPYWRCVLMVILLGAVARYALFPTVGYDENAQHLRLWTQLADHHTYAFDVVTQVWEVAPFAVALLHAITSLIVGEDARGALTLALMLLLFAQIWAVLAHFSLKRHDRLLMLALFASTPMLGSLLGTLQAELFLALMMAGGVRFALEAGRNWLSRETLVIAAIAAMCAATKLPGAVIGVLLLAAVAVQLSASRDSAQPLLRPWGMVILVLLLPLLALMALNSYLTAWKITGNPFFPLYNGIFKSPYFEAVNFSDSRWVKGFSLQSYWGLFFKTSSFVEAKDFVAGFQYLFLPFIALFAVGRACGKRLVIVLIPLVGFGITMFAMTQYWRYLFPALPLAIVVISALLWEQRGIAGKQQPAVARGAILACIALNLYFFPGISWVFEDAPQQAYTEAGRRAITERINPAKLITAYINERYPGATVLYPASAPFGATLKGSPVFVNWYAPSNQARFGALKSIADVGDFLKDENIGFVVWNTSDLSPPDGPEWLLRAYLSQVGYPELRIGNFTLYRIVGHDLAYREVFDFRKQVSAEAKTVEDDPPRTLANVPTDGSTLPRYHLSFRCQSATGRLVAQIKWETGSPYYRLIPCSKAPLEFSESLPIPNGASHAEIQFARQDTPEAVLTDIRLETN